MDDEQRDPQTPFPQVCPQELRSHTVTLVSRITLAFQAGLKHSKAGLQGSKEASKTGIDTDTQNLKDPGDLTGSLWNPLTTVGSLSCFVDATSSGTQDSESGFWGMNLKAHEEPTLSPPSPL